MILPVHPHNSLSARALRQLQRLSVNTFLQITGQMLPLVAAGVAIPLVYQNIGPAEFGVFTIGLSALGLFSLLDLGLGRAAVRFMARAFAEGNRAGAASALSHSAVLLGGFSLALCLALVAFAPLIASSWIQSDGTEHTTLRQCLYILAAALPFAGLTSVARSVLEARERFLLISIVQAIAGSLTYLVPLALSFGTRDVRVLIAGAALSRICGFTAFLAAARLVWPGEFPWSSVNLRAEREFREFSFWIVISNVIGTAIVYGDRALLVGMFGLTEVAFYNVPLEIVGRMMIIVNSAATVIFPSLARFAGKGMTLERVYVPLMTLLSVVAGAAFLALSIATPACLSLWLGETFQQHSSPVIRILLVGLGFQTLNVMALAMLNAGGMARPITLMHMAETPLYFGLLYLSGEHLGLPGIALVWSGRAVLEYLCFTGLQMRAAMPGSAGLQLTGSVLSAGNFIPLAIMAGSGQLVMAVLAGTVWALVSAFWCLSRLRAAHRQC